ncbi:MAG: hypothetical protein ACM31L_14640 [Actinomycetota bacterium]
MSPGLRAALEELLAPWSVVHAYSADPGAAACIAAIRGVLGIRAGRWLAEGWSAANGMGEPIDDTRAIARLAEPGACVVMGPQVDTARGHRALDTAAAAGLPVVFVLDHWRNYRQQLVAASGLPALVAVPDAHGLALLRREVPEAEALARVVGHFGIDATLERLAALGARRGDLRQQFAPGGAARLVGLLLDPVDPDQRARAGFDTATVLAALAEPLQRNFRDTRFVIRPHPREDDALLSGLLQPWRKAGIDFVVTERAAEEIMAAADEVWGLTSVVLIAAQTAGLRVRSLQFGRSAPWGPPHLHDVACLDAARLAD